MPFKQLLFRAEAREKIVLGAAALADAVCVTLAKSGAGGSFVMTE
jgi:hypothetical protein